MFGTSEVEEQLNNKTLKEEHRSRRKTETIIKSV